jgi:alanine dehydrogenase
LERATLDFHHGRVREHNLVDQTQAAESANLLQIHMAADDGLVSGFQMFAEERGGPERPNSRFVAVLDSSTRQLLALVDYWLLSPIRVGASAGVGCRYLAPIGARTVGILGSSKQARAQLQAIRCSVPSIERARVFSPTAAHREAFARDTSQWLGLEVTAVATPREAVEGADIVGIANNSRQPVFEMAWVKRGALVVTIGGANQLPADVAGVERCVAPNPSGALSREPYVSRAQAGLAPDDVVTGLGAVITKEVPVRRDTSDTVLFDVGRLNIWAVATAEWAYRWAVANEVGTPFTLAAE